MSSIISGTCSVAFGSMSGARTPSEVMSSRSAVMKRSANSRAVTPESLARLMMRSSTSV
jgi:hypothetical protein